MRKTWLIALCLNLTLLWHAHAQESQSLANKVLSLPTRFNEQIQKKTDKLEAQLTRQTEKYLQRLVR